MRFILELDKPGLRFPVDLHRYLDGAGVDFLALIKIRDEAALLEHLGADCRHIHEGHILLALLIDLGAGDNIFEPCRFNGACERALFNIHSVQLR